MKKGSWYKNRSHLSDSLVVIWNNLSMVPFVILRRIVNLVPLIESKIIDLNRKAKDV